MSLRKSIKLHHFVYILSSVCIFALLIISSSAFEGKDDETNENEKNDPHYPQYYLNDEAQENSPSMENKEESGKENIYPEITWGRPNTHTVYFDDSTSTNVTAVVGQKAELPCAVFNLGRKVVTWIRKRDIHILTVGRFTYTSDNRFTVSHPSDTEWNLEIAAVTFRDAGVYECQISTNPKMSLPISLSVEVQQARIPGPNELFIRNGSTISLTCIVNTHTENVGTLTWFRNGKRLDYNSPRGGVSLEVEKTMVRTTSKLFITRAIKVDSGNYTCAPQFADAASVSVHVVSGEESAAVQTGSASVKTQNDCTVIIVSLLGLCLISLLDKNSKYYLHL